MNYLAVFITVRQDDPVISRGLPESYCFLNPYGPMSLCVERLRCVPLRSKLITVASCAHCNQPDRRQALRSDS